MTEAGPRATDLDARAGDVDWIDVAAGATARTQGQADGRLAELVAWLASVQGQFPPVKPVRARCIVFGSLPDALPSLATAFDVGWRSIGVDSDAAIDEAFEFGVSIADDEAESGTDLLVLADPDNSPAAAVLVGLLCDAEPVSMLPRGSRATDTAAWVQRAEYLRDTRRRVARLRNRPDDLIAALAQASLVATAAFLVQATVRRIPVVLDGAAAVAAALLVADCQSRAAGWWQVADNVPDPVHARAIRELARTPVLDLGLAGGDGVAGVLAIAVLRAAALTAEPAPARGMSPSADGAGPEPEWVTDPRLDEEYDLDAEPDDAEPDNSEPDNAEPDNAEPEPPAAAVAPRPRPRPGSAPKSAPSPGTT